MYVVHHLAAIIIYDICNDLYTYHIAEIFCRWNFCKFRSFMAVCKSLTVKISIESGGVIISECVIILHNSHNVGIMDVASLSSARQYLPNSSFLNRHINMVASINGHHFVAL